MPSNADLQGQGSRLRTPFFSVMLNQTDVLTGVLSFEVTNASTLRRTHTRSTAPSRNCRLVLALHIGVRRAAISWRYPQASRIRRGKERQNHLSSAWSMMWSTIRSPRRWNCRVGIFPRASSMPERQKIFRNRQQAASQRPSRSAEACRRMSLRPRPRLGPITSFTSLSLRKSSASGIF